MRVRKSRSPRAFSPQASGNYSRISGCTSTRSDTKEERGDEGPLSSTLGMILRVLRCPSLQESKTNNFVEQPVPCASSCYGSWLLRVKLWNGGAKKWRRRAQRRRGLTALPRPFRLRVGRPSSSFQPLIDRVSPDENSAQGKKPPSKNKTTKTTLPDCKSMCQRTHA